MINGSEGFVARDNWLGVKLDGSAGANTKGIYIDPDSNGATIGGTAAADRNVIANNGFEGLDIEGADNADVLGNYFGVKPDGDDRGGQRQEHRDHRHRRLRSDRQRGRHDASRPGSAPCDGGCNVISGATSTGIDLQGNGGERGARNRADDGARQLRRPQRGGNRDGRERHASASTSAKPRMP